MFSKDYFGILQCMFMTNFEVVSSKMTELWLFYILSIYCIFGIEKFEISKKVFSKGYFIIMKGGPVFLVTGDLAQN